ncbi:MAG TPA: ROK family protein [Chryseosolibacter sp.]|nr:ROK family protein [Chryseosolibacter sp.]
MNNIAIGVDIGGSHITASAVDLDIRTVMRNTRMRQYVNSADEAARIINAWCDVIRSIMPSNRNDIKIGIAMPGPFDYEKGISYITGLGKYENLYGLYVKELMADVLGVSPAQIRMNNDAACFLHGEMFAGAGRGSSHAIGITLGTGTGTATHHAGTTKDANLGPSPFLDSIADNYLSTRWVVGEFERLSGKKASNVEDLVLHHGTDPIVQEIFALFSRNLALLLTDFIHREKPRIVVMGGNISKASDWFLPGTQKILRDNGIGIPIMKAVLGEDATILGAASLFTSVGRILSV